MTPAPRITEHLAADHQRLHALLTAACAGAALDRDAFARFRAGLLRHIAVEEKVLLPAARRARGGEPVARAYDLRVDHAALTSLLVPTPDVELCGEIVSLLTTHDAKEEGPLGVYAECEALFSQEESARLAAAAAAMPEVRVAAHYDGPEAHRSAATALASAQRIRRGGATG